jgi:hypothetical protein
MARPGEVSHIFEQHKRRLTHLNNAGDPPEKRSARFVHSELLSRLRKRLTRETCTEDIVTRNPNTRFRISNDVTANPATPVFDVHGASVRIDLGRENTRSAARLQRRVEATNTCEQVNKLKGHPQSLAPGPDGLDAALNRSPTQQSLSCAPLQSILALQTRNRTIQLLDSSNAVYRQVQCAMTVRTYCNGVLWPVRAVLTQRPYVMNLQEGAFLASNHHRERTLAATGFTMPVSAPEDSGNHLGFSLSIQPTRSFDRRSWVTRQGKFVRFDTHQGKTFKNGLQRRVRGRRFDRRLKRLEESLQSGARDVATATRR